MSWFVVKHQATDFLRLVGLRDRLRCPICSAVGTYKPHGGWLDFGDKKSCGRRWMCKWCGSMKKAHGWQSVRPDRGLRYWVEGDGITPQMVVRTALDTVNPWRG